MVRWLSGPKHAPAKRKNRRFESDPNLHPSLISLCRWYYIDGMKEQIDIITNPADLTVIRGNGKSSYSMTDGDTLITVVTSDHSTNINSLVSKYNNAKVRVSIRCSPGNPLGIARTRRLCRSRDFAGTICRLECFRRQRSSDRPRRRYRLPRMSQCVVDCAVACTPT